MLPSRPTLRGWNPDSLTATAAAITSSANAMSDAVKGIDDACQRMPETKAWSGRSHDAASAMFGRAERDASTFAHYANDLAAALQHGGGTIGTARNALLHKADQVDAGPLNVTDQWVVLIDPVRMSAVPGRGIHDGRRQAFGGSGAKLGTFVGDVVCPY